MKIEICWHNPIDLLDGIYHAILFWIEMVPRDPGCIRNKYFRVYTIIGDSTISPYCPSGVSPGLDFE